MTDPNRRRQQNKMNETNKTKNKKKTKKKALQYDVYRPLLWFGERGEGGLLNLLSRQRPPVKTLPCPKLRFQAVVITRKRIVKQFGLTLYGVFTLQETETDIETETDTDTDKCAQNPMGICVGICLCTV